MDGDDAGGSGGFLGALKAKIGPLPTWAWLGIITVLGLAYYLFEQHKAGSASTTATPDTTQGDASVPETVNQVTVNNPPPATVPPTAPPPTTSPPSETGTVDVPNVEGMHAADAVKTLQKAGLVAHLNRQTPPHKTGTILSQTPGKSKKVAKGSTVDLNNKVT